MSLTTLQTHDAFWQCLYSLLFSVEPPAPAKVQIVFDEELRRYCRSQSVMMTNSHLFRTQEPTFRTTFKIYASAIKQAKSNIVINYHGHHFCWSLLKQAGQGRMRKVQDKWSAEDGNSSPRTSLETQHDSCCVVGISLSLSWKIMKPGLLHGSRVTGHSCAFPHLQLPTEELWV